jgi:hypothetical protein
MYLPLWLRMMGSFGTGRFNIAVAARVSTPAALSSRIW